MAYPLVILGAGASNDFLRITRFDGNDQQQLNKWRPPLTNSLFDVSRFSEIIGKYEDVKPLASTIINIVESGKPFDFEKYLSDEEIKFPHKSYPQIMALRFYLSELFSKVSYYFFRHSNNHRHLIDQIEKRVGRAIVVNFNYDTLFEKNISIINSSNKVDNYVSGDIKVIKIHGAYNWRCAPKTSPIKENVYDFFTVKAKELYHEYKDHEVDPIFTREFDYSREEFDLNVYLKHQENEFPGGFWQYYLPAIAIPIGTKGNHICPKSHIDILTENLKQVDRVLVIGWRAQDEYLLNLMRENLAQGTKLTVVSNGVTLPSTYIEKFKSIKQIKVTDMHFPSAGYTSFMIDQGIEQFLID